MYVILSLEFGSYSDFDSVDSDGTDGRVSSKRGWAESDMDEGHLPFGPSILEFGK